MRESNAASARAHGRASRLTCFLWRHTKESRLCVQNHSGVVRTAAGLPSEALQRLLKYRRHYENA
jgi:hypothetical protein